MQKNTILFAREAANNQMNQLEELSHNHLVFLRDNGFTTNIAPKGLLVYKVVGPKLMKFNFGEIMYDVLPLIDYIDTIEDFRYGLFIYVDDIVRGARIDISELTENTSIRTLNIMPRTRFNEFHFK